MAMRIGPEHLRAHQERGQQQPVLDVQQRHRGRLGGPHLESMGEREQPSAHDRRLGGGEIREPAVLGATTGGDDAHLGQAEESPRERGDHVDGLDSRERDPQRLAPDEPGLDLEVAFGDPPSGHQPRDEPADAAEDQQPEVDDHVRSADHRRGGMPGCSAIDGTAMTITPISTLPKRTIGDSGCSRRQVSPTSSGAAAAYGRRHDAHRPVALASPTSASRSRSASASDANQPGDARVGRRRRGVELDRREAEGSIDRAGGDVDELHPPVGHHRHVAEHQAPGDDQVVLALGVAPGPVPTPLDEPGDRGDERDDHRQQVRPRSRGRSAQPRARR